MVRVGSARKCTAKRDAIAKVPGTPAHTAPPVLYATSAAAAAQNQLGRVSAWPPQALWIIVSCHQGSR